MADVRVSHQKIVVSDACVPTAALCAAMDIHVLAKDVVIPDREKGFLALELEILRLQPDRSEWIELVMLSDGRRSFNDDMRLEPATLANPDPVSDRAIRSDRHIGAEFSSGADNRCGMNHGFRPIEESKMASAASSDPT